MKPDSVIVKVHLTVKQAFHTNPHFLIKSIIMSQRLEQTVWSYLCEPKQ